MWIFVQSVVTAESLSSATAALEHTILVSTVVFGYLGLQFVCVFLSVYRLKWPPLAELAAPELPIPSAFSSVSNSVSLLVSECLTYSVVRSLFFVGIFGANICPLWLSVPMQRHEAQVRCRGVRIGCAECAGLVSIPAGKWFCPGCKRQRSNISGSGRKVTNKIKLRGSGRAGGNGKESADDHCTRLLKANDTVSSGCVFCRYVCL